MIKYQESQAQSASEVLSLKASFQLSLTLSLFAVGGILFAVFYGLLDQFQVIMKVEFEVGTASNLFSADQTPNAAPEIFRGFKGSKLMSTLFEFPFTWWVLCSYFPIVTRAYLGRAFSFKYAVSCTIFAASVAFIGAASNLSLLRYSSIFVSPAATVFVLRKTQPSDSRIASHLSWHIFILVLAFSILKFVEGAGQSSTDNLFLLCIVIPLIREVMRYASMRSAWYLKFDENVAGQEIVETEQPNRKRAFTLFVCYLQAFWAIVYRLLLANIHNPALAISVSTFQAILEIVLRLSMHLRDRGIKKMGNVIRHPKSSVQPVSLRDRTRTQVALHIDANARRASKDQYSEAKKDFYATALITEMASEYVAIGIAFTTVAFWMKSPLYRPYGYYSKIDTSIVFGDPGEFEAHLWPKLLLSFSVQILSELLVDTICIFVETNWFKLDVRGAWTGRHMGFNLYFLFATWLGCIAANHIAISQDNLSGCKGENMCTCVGNGLVSGGVRENFCYFVYPNSSLTFFQNLTNSSHVKELGNQP